MPEKELTAREAFEIALRNSPDMAAELRAAVAPGGWCELVPDDEKPDLIVGGHWPTKLVGSVRYVCGDCGVYVALHNGDLIAHRYPDVPVLCFDCAKKSCTEAE